MFDYKENAVFQGLEVSEDAFSLPTGGAVVIGVEFVKDGSGMWPTRDFYRVSGAIHPHDPNAYDILFQIGFPVKWNGRRLQICGGGHPRRLGTEYRPLSSKQIHMCRGGDGGFFEDNRNKPRHV